MLLIEGAIAELPHLKNELEKSAIDTIPHPAAGERSLLVHSGGTFIYHVHEVTVTITQSKKMTVIFSEVPIGSEFLCVYITGRWTKLSDDQARLATTKASMRKGTVCKFSPDEPVYVYP